MTRRFRRIFVFAAVTLCLAIHASESVHAQRLPSRTVKAVASSGDRFNNGRQPRVIWRKTIRVKSAQWIRLNFLQIALAEDVLSGTSSTLRIFSLKDGAQQFLTAETARQWGNTSAYFNGNAVRLELTAWPNGRLNRIQVETAEAGQTPVIPMPETICDVLDDRALSSDPRVGRTVPGGCTAWLFNDHKNCMLTAGHCAGSTSVVEFNVPLSNPDGTYNHPGPEHQYPVDPASMQFVDAGVGDDWCYFGCFANANTGLTAFEAQGDSFQLVLPPPVIEGDEIRITGFGSTTSPVDPTWNGVQKTHLGEYSLFTGSQLGYRTDTTGGNSGSPVIFESTGNAIGIHTHGGCSSGGAGSNSGTGANNIGLQTALANPLGICRNTVGFDFPSGRPAVIDPAGGTTMQVDVVNQGATPAAGTGLLHVDSGSGFQSVPLVPIGMDMYNAVFPAVPCGIVIHYYVSAQSTLGDTFTDPADAPLSFYSAPSAVGIQSAFADDFESDLGWTVSGDATDGQWDRGVPVGGGIRGDPPTDADGSGSCYLTDNVAGNSDVDGGSTTLTSPVMDATVIGAQRAILLYHRWFNNSAGSAPQEDTMVVEISNDNGANWVNLETVGPTGSDVFGGWKYKVFLISDVIVPTSQMRLRFTASDLINGSVVEAGVDGVRIEIADCVNPVTVSGAKLLDGLVAAGQLSDVDVSDDVFLQLDTSPTLNPFKQKVDLFVQTALPTSSPTTLGVLLEARAPGGPAGDVIQSIRLLNHSTGMMETAHLGTATPTESVVEVYATGDLSRFVQAGTNEITASVTWSSPAFAGTPFFWSVDVDQLVWLVE